MRIVAGCLLLLTGVLVPQRTSTELRTLYGQPEMERFLARPGISLTVEYGSDGVACKMRIEGEPPRDARGISTLLSVDDVTQVLDEAVPPETRGAKIGSLGGFQSGVTYQHGEKYENDSILRLTTACKLPRHECDVSASVTFARKPCENLNS